MHRNKHSIGTIHGFRYPLEVLERTPPMDKEVLLY